MLPPPPRSTLFPYTTLFRSAVVDLFRFARQRAGGRKKSPDRTAGEAQRLNFPGVIVTRDRKSTRLNSSHVRISYAVFCLKKKIPSLSSRTLTNNHRS